MFLPYKLIKCDSELIACMRAPESPTWNLKQSISKINASLSCSSFKATGNAEKLFEAFLENHLNLSPS